MDGAEEEGDREKGGRHQGEVEAGGDAFIHPSARDGEISLTVAFYENHGCTLGENKHQIEA